MKARGWEGGAGDLGCRVGRSWRLSHGAEARTVCLDCGTAVLQPARFCSGCGAWLAVGMPASTRVSPGGITPQQASLVRAVSLKRPDYLRRSFRRDPQTGQRVAHALQEREWSDYKIGAPVH